MVITPCGYSKYLTQIAIHHIAHCSRQSRYMNRLRSKRDCFAAMLRLVKNLTAYRQKANSAERILQTLGRFAFYKR